MTKLRIFLVILVASGAAVFALLRGEPRAARQTPGNLRIVSLAPNVTEILFALGLGDSLIGVTDRCNFPAEAARIERVSGFGSPNIEKLLSLDPTLVIASGLDRREVADILQQSGVRVLDVQAKGVIADFPSLYDSIRQIGQATDRSQQAEQLIERMQSELDSIEKQYVPREPSARPCVFVEIEESPLMTVGGGSFIDDLIDRAGGHNAAHDVPGAYPRINPEVVVGWNPEVILVAHTAHPGAAADRLARHIGWANIQAVQQRRVIDDINADLFFRPGPRIVQGVKALAERLHPR